MCLTDIDPGFAAAGYMFDPMAGDLDMPDDYQQAYDPMQRAYDAC